MLRVNRSILQSFICLTATVFLSGVPCGYVRSEDAPYFEQEAKTGKTDTSKQDSSSTENNGSREAAIFQALRVSKKSAGTQPKTSRRSVQQEGVISPISPDQDESGKATSPALHAENAYDGSSARAKFRSDTAQEKKASAVPFAGVALDSEGYQPTVRTKESPAGQADSSRRDDANSSLPPQEENSPPEEENANEMEEGEESVSETEGSEEDREIVYSFLENLPEAEAFIVHYVHPKRKSLPATVEMKAGRWDEDHFTFPEIVGEQPIGLFAYRYEDAAEKGIFFHPSQQGIKTLRFYHVPPGSTMVLYYGIDDIGCASNDGGSVYFNIWLGQHKLKRIRVLNEKGWKKETIYLGVVPLLKRGMVVTFEVTADNTKDRRFSFNAEILA